MAGASLDSRSCSKLFQQSIPLGVGEPGFARPDLRFLQASFRFFKEQDVVTHLESRLRFLQDYRVVQCYLQLQLEKEEPRVVRLFSLAGTFWSHEYASAA